MEHHYKSDKKKKKGGGGAHYPEQADIIFSNKPFS